MKNVSSILFLFLSLSLTGCVKVLPDPTPPPRRIVLTPDTKIPPATPKVAWDLKIEKPFTSEFLDVPRIALVRRTKDMLLSEYFAEVEWQQHLPLMVQKHVLDAFEGSGKIVGVGRNREHFRARYTLQLDVRHFEMEILERKPAQSHIEIGARLVTSPGSVVLNQKIFTATSVAGDRSLSGVAKAFERALSTVLKDLVTWTLAQKYHDDDD